MCFHKNSLLNKCVVSGQKKLLFTLDWKHLMQLQHEDSKLKGRSCSTAESLLHLHSSAKTERSWEQWRLAKTGLNTERQTWQLWLHYLSMQMIQTARFHWDLIINSTGSQTSKRCCTCVCPWLTKQQQQKTNWSVIDSPLKAYKMQKSTFFSSIKAVWSLWKFSHFWV